MACRVFTVVKKFIKVTSFYSLLYTFSMYTIGFIRGKIQVDLEKL
jgi:hypothetical protein